MKTVRSSRTVVLNKIQRFILVTFKDHIPKDVMHGLGELRQTLDLYVDDIFALRLTKSLC